MAAPFLRTWTRQEYERLAELGIFGPDERLELIDGQIVRKMTNNPPHVLVHGLMEDWLRSISGPDHHVRSQSPVALSELSEPEPDLAVTRGNRWTYGDGHPGPGDIELIVEVSDSSLDRDRRVKAPLYARAGVKEVWIADVPARKLEVYREPAASGYGVALVLSEHDSASPLFRPEASVVISELLPN